MTSKREALACLRVAAELEGFIEGEDVPESLREDLRHLRAVGLRHNANASIKLPVMLSTGIDPKTGKHHFEPTPIPAAGPFSGTGSAGDPAEAEDSPEVIQRRLKLWHDRQLHGNSFETADGRRIPPDQVHADKEEA